MVEECGWLSSMEGNLGVDLAEVSWLWVSPNENLSPSSVFLFIVLGVFTNINVITPIVLRIETQYSCHGGHFS